MASRAVADVVMAAMLAGCGRDLDEDDMVILNVIKQVEMVVTRKKSVLSIMSG